LFALTADGPNRKVGGPTSPPTEATEKGERMRRVVLCTALLSAALLLMPSTSSAQVAIAGVVKDGTGAVLPGVTVEASSPALIEKTRTVVTDTAGQYKIVDLSPGTYQVALTLAGLKPVKRTDMTLER